MNFTIHIPIWLCWGAGGGVVLAAGVFVGVWAAGSAMNNAIGRGLGW